MCASGLSKTDAEKMAVSHMSNIQLIFFLIQSNDAEELGS